MDHAVRGDDIRLVTFDSVDLHAIATVDVDGLALDVATS